MALGQQEDGVPGSLRELLALAVRSIQWSYAIFWSISLREPGVLVWGEGYYNGDIKTRKTVQAVEYDADQLGLIQRSEQLRELFESLSAGENTTQTKRPSAALSPEDLTDTEWYFLVCMSFTFNLGQGLPGRSLAGNKTIWLCNAHRADSKVFSRSLLAKSASIQTVVCFPHNDGVVELGVTDMVLEDPNIIDHIKSSFLGSPHLVVSRVSEHVSGAAADYEEVIVYSPESNADRVVPNQQPDEPFLIDDIINAGTSQVQSWQFMDEEISNCLHNSMNSSDCISQTFLNPEEIVPLSNGDEVENNIPVGINQKKQDSHDLPSEDIHYQSVLSTLLRSSHQLLMGPYFQNINRGSSFVTWKKKDFLTTQKPESITPQRLLKKALFEVAKMHASSILDSRELNDKRASKKANINEIDTNHVLTEIKRQEKINERFLVLESLVPSFEKVDKVTLLDATIGYIKELGKKIQEIDSFKKETDPTAKTRRKPLNSMERTSENGGNNSNQKRQRISKRKASNIPEEEEAGNNRITFEDSSNDSCISITMIEDDVLIETKCPWREALLIEIMDAVRNLQLDSHSIQSSNIDGILCLTIRSKSKKSTVPSTRKIRQALQRIIRMR